VINQTEAEMCGGSFDPEQYRVSQKTATEYATDGSLHFGVY